MYDPFLDDPDPDEFLKAGLVTFGVTILIFGAILLRLLA